MVYNPFAGWPVTGTWLGHLSYSDGGTDYPLGYNTDLPAPAAGTLQNHGMVGSAGRRATLWLDTPVARQVAAETREGAGPMVGIVFQHAASYNAERHYSAGEIIGKSGASANGSDYGGDVHLHIHGVNSAGQRVDFTKFIDGNTQNPGDTMTPAQEAALNARLDNIEKILAVNVVDGVAGGIRGYVSHLRSNFGGRFNNIESILAIQNDGGIRAIVTAIKAKVGA
ncbi:hypothetical protein [Plantibacter flavus]|uniref:hypothetical protein n=1 Tax=Plantibacter flavus TaxID=150123 RepID=UPI0013756A74|nr:hypothetical protein [Plantibacter flavus]